jgi:hypothetical protein
MEITLQPDLMVLESDQAMVAMARLQVLEMFAYIMGISRHDLVLVLELDLA